MRFKIGHTLADLVRAELLDYDRRVEMIAHLPEGDAIREAAKQKNALIDAATATALSDCLTPSLAAQIRQDIKNGVGYAHTQMIFCGAQTYKAYKRRMIYAIAHALRLI